MSDAFGRLDTPAIKALEDELKAENAVALHMAADLAKRCEKVLAPDSKRYRVKNIRKQIATQLPDEDLSEDTPQNGVSTKGFVSHQSSDD
jgi:hypothetical protein